MSFDIKVENGDIVFSSLGEIQTVSGLDKLKQDVAKVLLTEIGANVYHPWYGSELTDSVIGGIADVSLTTQNAESTINEALENLAALQMQQRSQQNVTPQETIGAIKEIKVTREPSDPRLWTVSVTVLSRSLSEITEEFNIAF